MTRGTPHSPHPGDQTPLAGVVHRNIAALAEVRRREDERRTLSDRVADGVTHFAGSMWSVAFHAVLFGGWLIVNLGWVPRVRPFDPFPFVMLAMIASVEAIFLSTFILVSQNRMQKLADRRAELDVQVSLLTEHELTRAIHLLDEIARTMNVRRPPDPELREIKQDVAPEKVVEEIARVEEQHERQKGL
jgi:uncharacterized membrane protein